MQQRCEEKIERRGGALALLFLEARGSFSCDAILSLFHKICVPCSVLEWLLLQMVPKRGRLPFSGFKFRVLPIGSE